MAGTMLAKGRSKRSPGTRIRRMMMGTRTRRTKARQTLSPVGYDTTGAVRHESLVHAAGKSSAARALRAVVTGGNKC